MKTKIFLTIIICFLTGGIIRLHLSHMSEISHLRMAENKCGFVIEKQEKIIEDLMSAFKR